MNASNPIAVRSWPDVLAMAGLIGLLDWLLLEFARGSGELSAVWAGNGVLIGWLMSRSSALWPRYAIAGLLADILARFLSGSPLPLAAALGLVDLVEVLIVAVAVRHRVPDLDNPAEWVALGVIATGSTLVACAVSVALASGASALFLGTRLYLGFVTWYAAHVVGVVVFGTATLVVHREGLSLLLRRGRRWSLVANLLLIGLVSGAVFSVRYPVLFLAYLPLLLTAFRHGLAGVAMGVPLFGLIGSVATAMGSGPVAMLDETGGAGRIAMLQLYIAGACVLTIPVALAIADRRRLHSRLRDSELRYRMLADYSHDVIVRMRANGERLYVSPAARDIVGWSPEEMLGQRWSLIHAEDRDRQQQTMAEVLASGLTRTEVYRVRHKAGHYVWLEAVARPIPSMDGKGMDIIYTGRDISRRVEAEQALKESRRELERLARVDTLTGVANRRQFEEALDLALLRARRHEVGIALMYLDVDHFKRINDTRGHAAGDQVLRTFARRLTECVRATDLVARLGGDEFVVIVEDAMLPAAAEVVAAKLLVAMREPIDVEGQPLVATTTIGIAWSHASVDAKRLLATADAALYAAKQEGRNRWHIQPVPELV